MKTRAVFDIECDNLLSDVTVVHCITLKDLNTGKMYHYKPHRIEAGLEKLSQYDILIGHNIIGYDLPVLKKLHGWEFKGLPVDTVIMSRILHRKRTVPKEMREAYKEAKKPVPKEAHGLESWGWTLGQGKVEHEDWSRYTEEMKHRNVVDVELNEKLYYKLKEDSDKQNFPQSSWAMMFKVFRIISEQVENGWKVDREKADDCIKDLSEKIAQLEEEIQPHLPHIMDIYNSVVEKNVVNDEKFGWREIGKKVGTEKTILKKPFTMAGKPSAHLLRWMEKTDAPDNWYKFVGGQFSRITYKQIEVKSGGDIKNWLLEQGWIPDEWNDKFEDGKKILMSPKLTEKDPYIGLKDSELCEKVVKYNQARHRLSTIEGYVRRIREDGRMESDISGLAETYRAKHRGLANVPNVESFYGKEMRELFIAEEGRVLVSADASGCQDRWLVSGARSYGIYDEVFEDMIFNGDKNKGTDSHSRAMKELNKVFEQHNMETISRGNAKNFNFAFKFNCQPKKLGLMAGLSQKKAASIGEELHAGLCEVFKAQKELEKHLIKEWRKTAEEYTVKVWKEGKRVSKRMWRNGYLKGLDGRPIYVAKEKDLLVYKVQSDEAIMFQKMLLIFHEKCDRVGLVHQKDFWQVCFYHDELTVETYPHLAEQIGELLSESIEEAAEFYGALIPQVGEYEVGQSWAEVH